mgnify:FL=1
MLNEHSEPNYIIKQKLSQMLAEPAQERPPSAYPVDGPNSLSR